MGLSPIFLSIIVASKNDPKRKNSSIFPVALWNKTKQEKKNKIFKGQNADNDFIKIKKVK